MKKQFAAIVLIGAIFLLRTAHGRHVVTPDDSDSSRDVVKFYFDPTDFDAGDLWSASLACTGGTRVFGIRMNDEGSAGLVIEKNGKLIYFNDNFEHHQSILSIHCMKNAIIIGGESGNVWWTSAVIFGDDGVKVEPIGYIRGLPLVEERNGMTSVTIYHTDTNGHKGDERPPRIEEQNGMTRVTIYTDKFNKAAGWVHKVWEKVTFHQPIRDPIRYAIPEQKVTFSPKIHVGSTSDRVVNLTALVRCGFNGAMAYTDDKNRGYVSANRDFPLPFVATNAMCADNGDVYLFGWKGEKLHAARFSFDKRGQEHLKIIDPAEAPLRPAK